MRTRTHTSLLALTAALLSSGAGAERVIVDVSASNQTLAPTADYFHAAILGSPDLKVSTDETFNLLGSLSHAAAVSGWLLSQPAYEALAMQCNVTLAEQASLSLNSLCFDAWWTEVLDAKAGESVLAAFDSPKGRDLVAKGAVNGTAQGAYWLFTSQETNGAYSALLSLTASLGASGSLSLKSPLDMTARQTKSEGVILGSNTAVLTYATLDAHYIPPAGSFTLTAAFYTLDQWRDLENAMCVYQDGERLSVFPNYSSACPTLLRSFSFKVEAFGTQGPSLFCNPNNGKPVQGGYWVVLNEGSTPVIVDAADASLVFRPLIAPSANQSLTEQVVLQGVQQTFTALLVGDKDIQTNQGQPISLVGTFESPVMLSAYLLDADSTSKILDGAPYDASSPVVTINQLNWGMLIATLPVLGSTTVYGSTVLDYSDTVQRIASSSGAFWLLSGAEPDGHPAVLQDLKATFQGSAPLTLENTTFGSFASVKEAVALGDSEAQVTTAVFTASFSSPDATSAFAVLSVLTGQQYNTLVKNGCAVVEGSALRLIVDSVATPIACRAVYGKMQGLGLYASGTTYEYLAPATMTGAYFLLTNENPSPITVHSAQLQTYR
jgi:hypothetical protein